MVGLGNGDITLAYYDTDLPQSITQGGTTTSYTLNTDGHRAVATTGPTGGTPTTTVTRHYTDTSDNPAWIDTQTSTGTTTTRYTESLGGDLGASIESDGTTTLTLNNLHGDTVTTVTIPAAQDATTNTTCINAWSDYQEFGTPRDTNAAAKVGGAAGYGWLGAKQRSTTTDSAGLTLMGDRLYNSTTGRFTALDPDPGGNPTAYAYPLDPVNQSDVNGHMWGWLKSVGNWAYQHRGTLATVGAIAGCAVPGVGWAACAGLQAAAWGVRSMQTAQEHGGYRRNWRSIATDGLFTALSFGGASTLRYLRYGRMGGGWRSGLARGFRNYSEEWQSTSRVLRWHAWGSTHASSTFGLYAHQSQMQRFRRELDW